METKSYGASATSHAGNSNASRAEEFRIQGYTVFDNLLDSQKLDYSRSSLDKIYVQQESEFGKDNLRAINELDLARCPFVYDEFFLQELILHETIVSFIRQHLGDFFQLHLQNGVMNKPMTGHHQSAWHRDLPYQNYVISKPIAISVLFCLDEFSSETGGTYLLPFSHQLENIPSQEYLEKYQKQITAPAGSAIAFNAMLFHRAGYNSSQIIRRGVNNVYSVPIIKQQIDLPGYLKGKYADDPFLGTLMGYKSQVPSSVLDFRSDRLKRIKK